MTALGQKVRNKLVARDGPNCYWCGCPTQIEERRASDFRTIDHLKMRREGGTNAKVNLVIACNLCNHRRQRLRYRKNPKLLLLERYKIIDLDFDPIYLIEEIGTT